MGNLTSEVIQLLLLSLGGLIWLIRLEGRLNLHEREVSRQFQFHETSRTELRDDVKYIRGRIDSIDQRLQNRRETDPKV